MTIFVLAKTMHLFIRNKLEWDLYEWRDALGSWEIQGAFHRPGKALGVRGTLYAKQYRCPASQMQPGDFDLLKCISWYNCKTSWIPRPKPLPKTWQQQTGPLETLLSCYHQQFELSTKLQNLIEKNLICTQQESVFFIIFTIVRISQEFIKINSMKLILFLICYFVV